VRRLVIAFAAACSLALPGGITLAAPAAAATCTQSSFRTVHNPPPSGVAQFLNADNFGGGDACALNNDGGSDFAIESQDVPYSGKVLAYPDLSIGCGFPPSGTCTPASGLPVKESAMSGARLTWATSHAGVLTSDRYNTSADLFFSADSAYTAPSAEVMIWLNEQNEPPPPSAVLVTIGAMHYYRWSNARTSGTFAWTETIYLRTPQATTVTNSAIKPVLDNAVNAGLLVSSNYLQYAGGGFELWQGGKNLATSAWTFTP
jgi:hypothetical protein